MGCGDGFGFGGFFDEGGVDILEYDGCEGFEDVL